MNVVVQFESQVMTALFPSSFHMPAKPLLLRARSPLALPPSEGQIVKGLPWLSGVLQLPTSSLAANAMALVITRAMESAAKATVALLMDLMGLMVCFLQLPIITLPIISPYGRWALQFLPPPCLYRSEPLGSSGLQGLNRDL